MFFQTQLSIHSEYEHLIPAQDLKSTFRSMFTIAAEIPVNLKKVETNILQRIAKKITAAREILANIQSINNI